MRFEGIPNRALDRTERRQVKHGLCAACGPSHGRGVSDVTDDEIEAAADALEVEGRAGRQVVERHDVFSERHQFADQIRSDEAGAAGH
jgi:hypothetical protein